MPGKSVTVYLKLNQITEVQQKDVFLKDVAEIYCSDQAIQNQCNVVKVMSIKQEKDNHYSMGVLEVIRRLEETNPMIQVNNIGETDFIIHYRKQNSHHHIWQWVKTAFVCLASFCGAAFAIMTFNNEASVASVFRELYTIVVGTEPDGFTIMEVSYSIGLAVGIIVFFNHFSMRKFNNDPTPIEVEMRLYEDNVNKTLIQNAGRKESGMDVN